MQVHTRRSVLRLAAGALSRPAIDANAENLVIGISDLLDGTAMVRVPAGEFQMGSNQGSPDERPVHRVRITRDFEICKYETTQGLWENTMRNAHTKPDVKTNASHFEGVSLPVETVTWDDAQEFLKRLNARDSSHNYRLPTEAEWEYACRGANRKAAEPKLSEVAWYEANAQQRTHMVATRQADALGLFDMLGNVAEWVQDWYAGDYYRDSALTDPQGPPSGSYRLYRGGCWFDSAKNCRATYRGFDLPANQVYNVGFRVVRTRNS